MNSKETGFKVLMEDLKVSFKFAAKNIISFFLGMIGVLIVTLMLLALAAAVVVIPLLFIVGGFDGIAQLFAGLAQYFTPSESIFFLGAGVLILLPLAAPLFVALGALFGMGREVVESAGTSAEGVFTWYRTKFFALSGGGIILFIVVLLPIAALYMSAYTFIAPVLSGLPLGIVTALAFTWLVISIGMMSMLFPGIIDGLSVIDATKQSFRMSIDHFERVFSVWISFLLIFAGLVLPLLAIPLIGAFAMADIVLMSAYAIPAAIFLVFIAFPALAIALSRVYLILSGVEVSDEAEESLDVSLVGGV
ncbi:MAG: hypothetical protein ACW99U_03435 [Candidatus Thorarchaeota archaeon]